MSCKSGPSVEKVTITPSTASFEAGVFAQLTAIAQYSDGTTKDVTNSATWESDSPDTAKADATGRLTAVRSGQATLTAKVANVSGMASITVTPRSNFWFDNVGLWTLFEQRGSAYGYFGNGQILIHWDEVDPVVRTLVKDEVSLQLDQMKSLGVNVLNFPITTADPDATADTWAPPRCIETRDTGLQWPQPTDKELAALTQFFDLAHSKGIKIWLQLINVHTEEQPPTNAQQWLTPIFNAIGHHPALDLVMFSGMRHLTNNGTACGNPAEPELWNGFGSTATTYMMFAMNLAMAQGLPAKILTAEAITGDTLIEMHGPSFEDAVGNHLWSPVAVEKQVFDALNIAPADRTYALSWYEHWNCQDTRLPPGCVNIAPAVQAEQTIQNVRSIVEPEARLVVAEAGSLPPVHENVWSTEHAMEHLIYLMRKYNIRGGAFWRWVADWDSREANPTDYGVAMKKRGRDFVYLPPAKELIDMGGYHLAQVTNGSFEDSAGGGVPTGWTASGSGTASQYLLTQEPGQPEVPSRGNYAMRLVTGGGPSDGVTATSGMFPVSPFIYYTTTANLRFAWTGDPAVRGPSASRPQTFVNILYYKADQTPSVVRAMDTFRFFQEDGTTGFATFPLRYAPPADASFVALQFGAARNGLPSPVTFDVDNVR